MPLRLVARRVFAISLMAVTFGVGAYVEHWEITIVSDFRETNKDLRQFIRTIKMPYVIKGDYMAFQVDQKYSKVDHSTNPHTATVLR